MLRVTCGCQARNDHSKLEKSQVKKHSSRKEQGQITIVEEKIDQMVAERSVKVAQSVKSNKDSPEFKGKVS